MKATIREQLESSKLAPTSLTAPGSLVRRTHLGNTICVINSSLSPQSLSDTLIGTSAKSTSRRRIHRIAVSKRLMSEECLATSWVGKRLVQNWAGQEGAPGGGCGGEGGEGESHAGRRGEDAGGGGEGEGTGRGRAEE